MNHIRFSNRTIVDIKKVAYARLIYRAKEYSRELKPKQPTVRGVNIDSDGYALPHLNYPKETLLERAKRLDILDKWEPVLVVMLTNGHRLEYTGEKAKSIHKLFSAKIFKE